MQCQLSGLGLYFVDFDSVRESGRIGMHLGNTDDKSQENTEDIVRSVVDTNLHECLRDDCPPVREDLLPRALPAGEEHAVLGMNHADEHIASNF